MRTRRIAATACTLCLAIPAAAGASPATFLPRAPSVLPPAPPTTVKAKGPYGIVPPGPPSTVQAKGPYGIVPPGPRSTVPAKGPYGIVPSGPRITTKGINAPLHPQSHAAGASHRHATNGWRAAAVAEAALLAALALGCALVLTARRRSPRMVT